MFSGLSLPAIGLSLLFSIGLCVHAVRTGKEMYWLFIILMFQPLGGLVYLIAIVVPEFSRGSTAQKVARTAREAMDPEREYREASQKVQDTPTVANQMRLAAAASVLGRHDEAEKLYGEAARGIHAEDPALLVGRARALLELNRAQEARTILLQLAELGDEGRTPVATLALARAHEALDAIPDADAAYQQAVGRLPGLEAMARYAVFLSQQGRGEEARTLMAEITRRADAATAHFRKEARAWRDFAAQKLGT